MLAINDCFSLYSVFDFRIRLDVQSLEGRSGFCTGYLFFRIQTVQCTQKGHFPKTSHQAKGRFDGIFGRQMLEIHPSDLCTGRTFIYS